MPQPPAGPDPARLRPWRGSIRALVALGAIAAAPLPAQVPNPARAVHPAIAAPVPGLVLQPAPLFAAADGHWNHGEGFPGGGPASDTGGWFGSDDGTGVSAGDVHAYWGVPPWSMFEWFDPRPGGTAVAVRRFVGYLRPAGLPLPTVHPRYGALGATYVDQAAFEAFAPVAPRAPGQPIVVCIRARESLAFPRDAQGQSRVWRQVYMGLFSPDGLCRPEPTGAPISAATFLGNTQPFTVERPSLELLLPGNQNPAYWPIVAHAVPSVSHRSTTLNEQRDLQLVQAVKLLLQEDSPRNPLGAGNQLSAAEVESAVVVVFAGGSNGGLQGHWAALRHPRLVHGVYAEVINPSMQRLYGEHDFGHAVARLGGTGLYGATVHLSDFLWWNQYLWKMGLEAHDLSYPRRFVAGQTHRPVCFAVGDEDITSTGTDWIRLVSGGAWTPAGLSSSASGYGSPAAHTFAWMVAENTCHQGYVVPTRNAYDPQASSFAGLDSVKYLCEHAVAQRAAELSLGQQPPAGPPAHQPRSAAQQFRGLDDPHEWFLGRPGGELAPVDQAAPLRRDDDFFAAVQPDTAGSMPGAERAMLIRDGRLYVGCAEGIVSRFRVETSGGAPYFGRQPLVREARSARLGNDAFALAASDDGGGWSLVVGTRRHLYRLDPATLAVLQGPVELPWEVAQPRHMQVANVLPQSPGNELVFHAVHGGLVFYRAANLQPIYEWPEPGIVDFVANGPVVTILSSRGLLANVTFAPAGGTYTATLHAVSRALPASLAPGSQPCQGIPKALALMRVNWTAAGIGSGNMLAAISAWSGDTDGHAVRGHWLQDLSAQPFVSNTAPLVAIATCTEQAGYYGSSVVGDHALLLGNGVLMLYDQFGQQLGSKLLNITAAGHYHPFGSRAHAMAVGELVPNSGPYSEEIVVATTTGLFWLHVNDLLAPGPLLSDLHEPLTAVAGQSATAVQPRTNRTLAAAWAIARGEATPTPTGVQDLHLHVLDQRGAYWRVGPTGAVSLHDREAVLGARAWSYLGNPTGSAIDSEHLSFPPPLPLPAQSPLTQVVQTFPWCPIRSDVAVFEQGGPGFVPYNWRQRDSRHMFHHGFLVHPWGGAVLPTPAGREAWFWSVPVRKAGQDGGDWGNHFEALRCSNQQLVTGVWSSSGWPESVQGQLGNRAPYHNARTITDFMQVMSQQAVRVVRLSEGSAAGQVAVVLGCPGGRVRVVLPGAMRTPGVGPHQIGSMFGGPDLGFGGSALAVRHDVVGGEDVLRIWFGTLVDPPRRPTHYANPAGALGDLDVATGAVHQLEWRLPSAGGTGFTLGPSVAFHPVPSAPRGAYGVAGLALGDLLVGPEHPGDELVVATLSGDVIVFAADSMTEIWRTFVLGAAGMHNAVLIEDLDGDGRPELYVGGSYGLWRFVPGP